MSSRRQARRTALVLLYQWDLTGQPLGSLYLGDIDPFALELARPVVDNAPALDARITEAAEDWTADRLGAVERNVLRLAVQELETGETPREVAIAEAVALSKRYASPDAARLVNGILGRIAQWDSPNGTVATPLVEPQRDSPPRGQSRESDERS